MRASTRRRPRSVGRLRRHRADGVLVGAEPNLAAVKIELSPEPEGSRSVPGWTRARSGSSRRRASPRASAMTIASSPLVITADPCSRSGRTRRPPPASSASPAPDGLPAMKCHRSSGKGRRVTDAAGARAALLERRGPPGSDTPRGQPWSPPPERGSCPTIPAARGRGPRASTSCNWRNSPADHGWKATALWPLQCRFAPFSSPPLVLARAPFFGGPPQNASTVLSVRAEYSVRSDPGIQLSPVMPSPVRSCPARRSHQGPTSP